MADRTDVQRWQMALMSESGPHATIRHILIALSVRMKKDGDRAFPSIRTITKRTGLSEPTVCKRLHEALAAGWVQVLKRPNKRSHQYLPAIPGERLPQVEALKAHLLAAGATPKLAQDTKPASAHVEPRFTKPVTESTEGRQAPPLKLLELSSSKSTSESISSRPSPPSAPMRRDADGPTRTAVRAALIEHCLLGREQGADEHGRPLGIGLLLKQFDERVVGGQDPEALLGALSQVRRDEDAPPPNAAFSLRWFDGHPGRLARCVGAYHKAASPHPVIGLVDLAPLPGPDRRGDTPEQARQKLAQARAAAEGWVRV